MSQVQAKHGWLRQKVDGRRSTAVRYLLALLIALAAVAARLLVYPWVGSATAPLTFAMAVTVSAYVGGLGPGLLATAITGIATPYLVIEPRFSWAVASTDDQLRLAALVILGIVISVLSEKLLQAKHEAEEANRAKDHFLAALSHELRTPLTPVLLVAESLEGADHLPPEILADLQTIRRNVTLETRLIDDLLDLSRVASGKLTLRHEPVDVHEVLRYAAGVVSGSFVRARRLKLNLELTADNPWVRGDAVRLQQVFWNLIRNAIKFTPEGGTVTVRARNVLDTHGTECVRVEVQDTGVGISKEFLSTIFNAFTQESLAVTHRFGGLGMGLAIARSVVEAHGGTIEVASEGKGKGATFSVQLTAQPKAQAEEAVARSAAVHSTPVSSRALQVLLVEDNQDTARLLARLLTAHGNHVRTAGSVREALELAQEGTFDVMVSDLGLPDGSGLDVLKGVRQLGRDWPAVAISGYGMSDDLRRSRQAGFIEHLVKPLDIERLVDVLQQVTQNEGSSVKAPATQTL